MGRILLVAGIVATVGVGLAPAAQGAACGGGFVSMAVQDVLRSAGSSQAGRVQAADGDGDGLVCVKVSSTSGGSPQIDPALIVVDN